MKAHIDIFTPDTDDESEWSLAGWAFVPGGEIEGGRWELGDGTSGPLSCAWPRPDLLAAFPSECPSENAGFQAHVILPTGLQPGTYELELIFLSRQNEEAGRIRRTFSLRTGSVEGSRPAARHPQVGKEHPQAAYLDLLERTLLGLPYKVSAHTMIGMERLHHLRACAETSLRDGVPGDFVETGVWRGGACILMRGVLRAFDDRARNVWVIDSFSGLPEPNAEKYPADRGDTLFLCKELAIPLEQVRDLFDRYGLLDGQVKFLKGWFSQTLPDAPVKRIAVLRLDGDMYESTMDALIHLYPKLSTGGFCIVDDYGCIPACRRAVRDYRASQAITEPIAMIDWTGAFWRKDCGVSPKCGGSSQTSCAA